MQLYQKQQKGKAIRYVEYIPEPIHMPEIENNQVITLLATLTISMLMSVSNQLPDHATLSRKIRKVEDAVKELAALTGEPLDPVLVEVGVAAWNSAMYSMQSSLSGGKEI